MLHLDRVLLAYDFSQCSEHAAPFAADLSARADSDLHVLYVDVLPWEVYELPPVSAPDSAELTERLQKALAPVEGRPLPAERIHSSVVHDVAAAPALLQYADRQNIDLVVLGTHGRRGLRHLMLGSVAEEVVRRATCPVLTVHHCDKVAPTQIRRLLVPIDFSPSSLRALEQARVMAEMYDAPIDLLFVAETRKVALFNDTGLPVFSEIAPDEEIVGHASEALRQAAAQAGLRPEQVMAHVRAGHPDREIAALARERQSDLVVLATHGVSALRHFLMGSVAERVVRSAPCPVLTLRAFGRDLSDPPHTEETAFTQ